MLVLFRHGHPRCRTDDRIIIISIVVIINLSRGAVLAAEDSSFGVTKQQDEWIEQTDISI